MGYASIELPRDMSLRLADILNLTKPPATLGDLFEQARVFAWSEEALVSPSATRHQVATDGEPTYTHCALDALTLPSVTGHPAVLRTACPHCGNLFPDMEHYQRWAQATPEAIVIPLSLTDVAELVRDVSAPGASCC